MLVSAQILLCILELFNITNAPWYVTLIPLWIGLAWFIILVIVAFVASILDRLI